MTELQKLLTVTNSSVNKTIKKQWAFEALCKVIENTDIEQCKHNTELRELFNYFEPKAIQKAKTDPWAWICQGLAEPKDHRYSMETVHVNEDHIVASNGRILFLMPNTDNKEAGQYDKSGYETDDNTYPTYKHVIPDPTEAIETIELEHADVKAGKVIQKTQVMEIGGKWFNIKYLKQILIKGKATVSMFKDDPYARPARFDFDDGSLAVLMPMRDN